MSLTNAKGKEKKSRSREIIIDGYYHPIRNSMDPVFLDAQLTKAIMKIADAYGGRKTIKDIILEECLDLLIAQFSHLGIDEIREAYRLWATRQFEVQGAEMYGGQFNALNMARVLSGYENYRKTILEAHLRKKRERDFETQQKQKSSIEKQQFEQNLQTEIQNILQKASSWQDIPSWIYFTVQKRGMLKIGADEAQKIYDEALIIAKKQREKEKQEAISKNCFQSFNAAMANNEEGRAKVIAGKMAVFTKLKI